MKVRVNPDGSMEFDVNDVSEISALVSSGFLSGIPTGQQNHNGEPRRRANDSPLNPMQYKTWSYLVDNEAPSGIHIGEIARHLGVKRDNASWWCQTLTHAGLAERVTRGYYRAVEKDGGVA